MNKRISKKVQEILEKNDAIFYDGIVEPGYDNKPAILADWNNIPRDIFIYLEKRGISCEWEDEWISCEECGKLFRCVPDSYGWEMCGVISEGSALCGNCINPAEYLESIENLPTHALTCALLRKINPEKFGYTLLDDKFENGFYPGQNDDPKIILASLLKDNPNGKYIFVIMDQGQFDISFSVYKKD
jgi:hypothetical protein